MKKYLFLLIFCFPVLVFSQGTAIPGIQDKTVGMNKYAGYFNFYWEEKTGKIWLEIEKFEEEFLYVNSLPAGVGSNDIGLDRGQLGDSRIVKFRRIGPKVLLIQPNYDYRANSTNPDERQSVEQAFAQSVIWGFEVAAEEGKKVLVDATNFYLNDAHNVALTLKNTQQGDYKVEISRSAIYLPRTKNFPQNTEVEAILTFTGNPTGNFIRQVVPSPNSLTVRQHHSFVQLPDNNYKPRIFDPRAGYFGINFMDFATPVEENIVKRYICRHRLAKKNPEALVSEAVEPLIYYIDSGAPELVRQAMFEAAAWWNQAYEAIGYKDAFQVKLLPEDADPMDVRYNVIQWVHRATRGWSYGSTVTDPRSGEIIKGHVTLGSLRIRQDYLIAEGILAPYQAGKEIPAAMKEIAVARLKQLIAHEIGHTLGLVHNFAASMSNRASVMDYPHPLFLLNEKGEIDWSNAYSKDMGEWDKIAIAYGYADFPKGTNEKEALNNILRTAFGKGISFISDNDARATGGMHPQAHLWDNGSDASEELNRVMKLREKALTNFSEKNIRESVPMSSLEDVLVPVYLYHRYQVEATVKLIGGLNYSYALRGDGQKTAEIVAAKEQKNALDALLNTIKSEVLLLPEKILRLIPPKALGYYRGRENFITHTGLSFDPLAAAETASDMTIKLLLHPERAARLIEYNARDNTIPGLSEVLTALLNRTWRTGIKKGLEAEIQKVVNQATLNNLIRLASEKNTLSQVKAISLLKLDELKEWLKKQETTDEGWQAHYRMAKNEIEKFQQNPEKATVNQAFNPPAGAPIGDTQACDWE